MTVLLSATITATPFVDTVKSKTGHVAFSKFHLRHHIVPITIVPTEALSYYGSIKLELVPDSLSFT